MAATTAPSRLVFEDEKPPRRGLAGVLQPEEGWVAFLLLAALSLVTVHTVEEAKWVKEMPSLVLLALAALFTGYVLSRVRVPAILLHPVGLVVGFLAISERTVAAAAGESFNARMADAASRLTEFWRVAQSGGISLDGLPFVVQVLIFTWLVGYFSAWFLYRSRSSWLAILPPAIALLVNLTYLPGRFGLDFGIFTLCAVLLVMHMHVVELRRQWRREGVPERESSQLSATGPMLTITGVLAALTFFLPMVSQSPTVTAAWERVTQPWRGVEREFDRLFASVSSGKVAPLHTFGDTMAFRGAVNFGDQLPLADRLGLARDVIMYVEADEPGYWRAASYDTYTGQGWVNPPSEKVLARLPEDPVPGALEEYKDRRPFTQTVEFNTPLDVLFVRGMPVFGTAVSNEELARPASFTLYLTDQSKNQNLPADLQSLARTLNSSLNQPGRLPDRNAMQSLLPPDLRVGRPVLQGTAVEALEVRRTEPFPPDVYSVRPLTTLARGQRYTITSSVSVAPVEALREAGDRYPGWVRDRYLQLPDKVPQRVRDLARQWSQDADNAFDKATAIETRLREIPYNTNIPPPPRDNDGVDYFLFTLKRGYADYYASSMAVLLRSLGIPARVAVGYVSGDWDTEKEHYVVREIHAHAWVEVFFPAYGWIEFNPSPNWPTVPRIYSSAFSGSGEGSFPEDEDDFGMLDPDAETDIPSTSVDLPATAPGGTSAAFPGFIGVLAAMLLAVMVVRLLWLRGLRRLSFAAQTYEKMVRLAVLARVKPDRSQTPWEYSRVLAAAVPPAEREVHEIAVSYNRSLYGQQPVAPRDQGRLDAAWRIVRKALLLRALRFWERGRTGGPED